jgi:hypothetical protein
MNTDRLRQFNPHHHLQIRHVCAVRVTQVRLYTMRVRERCDSHCESYQSCNRQSDPLSRRIAANIISFYLTKYANVNVSGLPDRAKMTIDDREFRRHLEYRFRLRP